MIRFIVPWPLLLLVCGLGGLGLLILNAIASGVHDGNVAKFRVPFELPAEASEGLVEHAGKFEIICTETTVLDGAPSPHCALKKATED